MKKKKIRSADFRYEVFRKDRVAKVMKAAIYKKDEKRLVNADRYFVRLPPR